MKRYLFPLLLLAACGTPQEQCISYVTRDLRNVDRLIAETEGNLQRGYAYDWVTETVTVWVPCFDGPVGPDQHRSRGGMCLDDRDVTNRRAVAIDLKAEAAKLAGLKAKRKELARAAVKQVAQCKADNPQ